MIMDFRWIDYGTPEFDQALDLRNRVLRVPLGLQFNTSDIEAEWDSHHLAVFTQDGTVGGCLVMKSISPSVVKMRQVAVDPQLQGKGIGMQMVRESEKWAKQHGLNKIELHARIEAVPFYLKMNYLKEGDQFEEVGIPHYKMSKSL